MTQNTRSGVGRLSDDKRKAIALQALTRTEPISVLAERNGVSRPTVYRQIGTASVALDEAFDTTRAADADQVLFMLPVTRQWLDQGRGSKSAIFALHRRAEAACVRKQE
ncbi:transposase-like protein [Paraburkholderia sp. JPY465]|uniref:hypothetical protein n=1 Tax=Paraburkholderia sp. JPY465 TaxID=3042285 RepID=UPI003D1A1E91